MHTFQEKPWVLLDNLSFMIAKAVTLHENNYNYLIQNNIAYKQAESKDYCVWFSSAYEWPLSAFQNVESFILSPADVSILWLKFSYLITKLIINRRNLANNYVFFDTVTRRQLKC